MLNPKNRSDYSLSFFGIFAITYFLAFKLAIPYNIAAPAALIEQNIILRKYRWK
ncbi:MAG: hypothetical protein HN574_03855 [Gammaproteobacteria bacterium]|jgi:hypothetical protein|nr:hypothetical protein [Gammaproteobacteria bacterium]